MSLAEDLNPRAVPGHNQPPLAAILLDRYAEILREADVIDNRANSLPKTVSDDIGLGRLGDVVKDARKLVKRIDTKRGEEVEPHLTAQRETNAFFKVFTERLDVIVRGLEQRATDYNNAKAAEERRIREEQARRAREEEDRQRQAAEAAAARNRHGAALKHEDRAEEAAERARRAESAAQASAADLTRVRSGSGTVATTRTEWKFEVEDIDKVPLEKLRPYLPRADLEKAIRSFVRVGGRDLAGVRIFQDNKATFR